MRKKRGITTGLAAVCMLFGQCLAFGNDRTSVNIRVEADVPVIFEVVDSNAKHIEFLKSTFTYGTDGKFDFGDGQECGLRTQFCKKLSINSNSNTQKTVKVRLQRPAALLRKGVGPASGRPIPLNVKLGDTTLSESASMIRLDGPDDGFKQKDVQLTVTPVWDRAATGFPVAGEYTATLVFTFSPDA